MLAYGPFLPAMLVGGLHFCLIGTPIGLMVFMALSALADGKPELLAPRLAELPEMLGLAAMFGALPAFAAGAVAALLRLALRRHLVFVVSMAPVGAATTTLYLWFLLGGKLESGFLWGRVIETGAITAFLCALPYGFWLKSEVRAACRPDIPSDRTR